VPKIKNHIKNILISGGGGDIGIAICRILKEEKVIGIFGCDIIKDHVGECLFDLFFYVSRASDASYFIELEQIFIDKKVELFIPSSEAEIEAILDYGLDDCCLFGVPVLIADESTVRIALDKYSTASFLARNGIKSPWTLPTENIMPKELPCIFKPRSGQGSKGLEIVSSESRAKELVGTLDYIWQELLLPDEQEYTCGIYRSKGGECRSILMRRTLSGGFTEKGEVVEDAVISTYVNNIATVLGVEGAVNFQLRLTDKGPVLFEINPRFSSSVMFRHKLGFRDLVWALEEKFGLELSSFILPKAGTKFYRGNMEYLK